MTAGLRAKEEATRDSRMHLRKRMRNLVEFALSDGTRHAGVCKNMSLGGIQIEATLLAPFGARVTIFLVLDGVDGETPLGGIVRWTKPGVMGIQFDLCSARTTYALLRTLANSQELA